MSDEVVKLLRARHATRVGQLPDCPIPKAATSRQRRIADAGTDLSGRTFIHALLRRRPDHR